MSGSRRQYAPRMDGLDAVSFAQGHSLRIDLVQTTA